MGGYRLNLINLSHHFELSMRNIMIKIISLLIYLLVPVLAYGSAHYVSPTGTDTWANSTNISTPCSISTANSNIQAGDKAILRGGTYTISSGAAINPTNNGTCDPPGTPETDSCKIIYEAYPGETPLFTANLSSDISGISLTSKKYIKITGTATGYITFENFGRWGPIVASHHNEFAYLEFYNTALGGPFGGSGGVTAYSLGFYFVSSGGVGSTHNWLHHSRFHYTGRAGMDE